MNERNLEDSVSKEPFLYSRAFRQAGYIALAVGAGLGFAGMVRSSNAADFENNLATQGSTSEQYAMSQLIGAQSPSSSEQTPATTILGKNASYVTLHVSKSKLDKARSSWGYGASILCESAENRTACQKASIPITGMQDLSKMRDAYSSIRTQITNVDMAEAGIFNLSGGLLMLGSIVLNDSKLLKKHEHQVARVMQSLVPIEPYNSSIQSPTNDREAI